MQVSESGKRLRKWDSGAKDRKRSTVSNAGNRLSKTRPMDSQRNKVFSKEQFQRCGGEGHLAENHGLVRKDVETESKGTSWRNFCYKGKKWDKSRRDIWRSFFS